MALRRSGTSLIIRERTHTLALVITDVTNPFWTTVARGAEDKAVENGLSVILCNTDEDPEKEESYIDVLLQKRVDGVVIAPVSSNVSNLRSLSQQGIPYVVVDRRVEGMDTDLVIGDSVGGAYELTKHLIELGHRRIGIIAGPEQVSTAEDRLAGYLKALEEFDIPVDEALIKRGKFDQGSGYELTKELLELETRPTALFAGNNFIAIGALTALRERGIEVPDEMALVTFDEIPQLSAVYPFLTVAAQPAYDMGTIATELLLERLDGEREGNREVVLETELILRRSSGAPVRLHPITCAQSGAGRHGRTGGEVGLDVATS
ncbi:MAG: substrate-binding domain-containing protein [Chloroflexota bacterium]|nr:substrate-binding domain-containing protein [Chloroflexota bacterium]